MNEELDCVPRNLATVQHFHIKGRPSSRISNSKFELTILLSRSVSYLKSPACKATQSSQFSHTRQAMQAAELESVVCRVPKSGSTFYHTARRWASSLLRLFRPGRRHSSKDKEADRREKTSCELPFGLRAGADVSFKFCMSWDALV